MPKTMARVRVHNPGRAKRRKLSPAQVKFFGTKRQRAALKASKHKKRTSNGRGKTALKSKREGKFIGSWMGAPRKKKKFDAKAKYKLRSSATRGRATKSPEAKSYRKSNPGEIITLAGLAGNPGRKRKRVSNMAKRRRTRRKAVASPVRRRRTRRTSNPKVVVRYRTRRRAHSRRRANVGYRVRARRTFRRRRNAGSSFLSGGVGMMIGIFGGAALTGAISSRVPVGLNNGIAGYLTTAAIAYVQGMLVGKLLKNPTLGKNATTGGLLFLGLKVMGDVFPQFSLPFGLSGLGAIAQRDPYTVPMVPNGNSMVSFLPVSNSPMPSKGIGRIARLGRGL